MNRFDIERIAGTVVREYGLPLRLDTISFVEPGRCVVRFAERFSPTIKVSVGVWCDEKVSPHNLRESIKNKLLVND